MKYICESLKVAHRWRNALAHPYAGLLESCKYQNKVDTLQHISFVLQALT